MRLYAGIVSYILLISLAGNLGFGYYLYTFEQTNRQLNAQIIALKQALVTNATHERDLQQRITVHTQLLTYTRDQLAQTTAENVTLAQRVAQLEVVVCPQQLDPQHVASATTLAQITRIIETFYAQQHAATMTNTTITDRRNNVQIQLFFTKNNDNMIHEDLITISYAKEPKKERTPIRMIMSTTCVLYVATVSP